MQTCFTLISEQHNFGKECKPLKDKMLESKSTFMCCFKQTSSSFNVFKKLKGQVFPHMENR